MTDLAFIDTETTSLRYDRRVWEVAVIRYETGKHLTEWHSFVELHDLDLGNADPASLKVGRFYDRHPQAVGASSYTLPACEADVMRTVEEMTRGCHLVGMVPSFDAEVLGNRMRANGVCPSWHYHLIDVETLIAGKLGILPPWHSEELSQQVGVDADDFDRHTAAGDAHWARTLFQTVMS